MTEKTTLQALIDAARAPLRFWIDRYPERAPLGNLCSYVPEEILHAAGFTPLRLRGHATSPGRSLSRGADAHLQSFTCALCRSTLDQALAGEVDLLPGIFFAHTCDTMQALADLWRINVGPDTLVEVAMQPTNLGSPAARPYLIAELGRIRERLGAFTGKPIGDADLRASIALYDEARRLVQALQQQRERLSASEFFAVLDAAQVMPRERFNPLLAALLAELQAAHSPPLRLAPGVPTAALGARLILAGAVLDEPRLLDLIEELGAQVVGDDLCSGSRHFSGQVGDEGDPIAALADYYLRRPPCPCKFYPDHDPGQYLLDQARQVRAQGIVFALEKFCDPHAFDYALARPALERAGLPHLLLELEQSPSLEAMRTRLQAFIETL